MGDAPLHRGESSGSLRIGKGTRLESQSVYRIISRTGIDNRRFKRDAAVGNLSDQLVVAPAAGLHKLSYIVHLTFMIGGNEGSRIPMPCGVTAGRKQIKRAFARCLRMIIPDKLVQIRPGERLFSRVDDIDQLSHHGINRRGVEQQVQDFPLLVYRLQEKGRITWIDNKAYAIPCVILSRQLEHCIEIPRHHDPLSGFWIMEVMSLRLIPLVVVGNRFGNTLVSPIRKMIDIVPPPLLGLAGGHQTPHGCNVARSDRFFCALVVLPDRILQLIEVPIGQIAVTEEPGIGNFDTVV